MDVVSDAKDLGLVRCLQPDLNDQNDLELEWIAAIPTLREESWELLEWASSEMVGVQPNLLHESDERFR